MKYLQISLRHWGLSVIVSLAALGGLEVLFRSEILWRGPLGLVITLPTDISTRGVWLSYKEPMAADRHVLLVGASTAEASMELPDEGTSQMFSQLSGQGRVQFKSLCTGGATFAEYLAFVDNALAHGYTPDLVIVYTAPGMFTPEEAVKARQPTRDMPIVSPAWLQAMQERDGRSPGQSVYHWALTHLAIMRHRYYVNTWLRTRFERALRRDFRLIQPYNDSRYRDARRQPLDQDPDRFQKVSTVPERFRPESAAETGFIALLQFLQRRAMRVVLVEAPRSPPSRKLLAPVQAQYEALVNQLAQEYETSYFDPNELVYLEVKDFADLYHVSWAGRVRWLETVVPRLASLIA